MTVAVDTNILLDIVLPDEEFVESSYRLLTHYMEMGSLIISDVVYSELAVVFHDEALLTRFLEETNVRKVPNSTTSLWRASRAWQMYNLKRTTALECAKCGFTHNYQCNHCGANVTSRQHIISDFLIGAHAQENAHKLLTRDRGFFSRYFPDLIIQENV